MLDCGVSSTLIISNLNSVPQTFSLDGVTLSISGNSSLAFSCSGQLDFIGSVDVVSKMVSSSQGIFGTDFLLGFAGIVCALLITLPLIKNGT